MIDGVSLRALSEIAHLEDTRSHLSPGEVADAVRLWKDYVHRPARELWRDHDWGSVHWDCCGNPLEARALLDTVLQAMSAQGARELRRIIGRFDALWRLPSPPYGDGGG